MTPPTHYERFEPSDNCLHGKYCGRYAMFITQCEHRYDGPNVSVVVPQGTPTDFASVPWPLTVIYPNVGPYARAAVFHDQLYIDQTVSRAVADALFLHWMRIDKTPAWQRYPMYWAVRWFGWIYWNRRAEKAKRRSKP